MADLFARGRFVQIGSVSGADITSPSAVLRASAIELMGSGIGSIRLDEFAQAIGDLLQATISAGFQIATHVVPLADVAQAWSNKDDARRIVLTVA